MHRTGLMWAMAGAVVLLGSPAMGQLESHCLPPDMSPGLFPLAVSAPPSFEVREIAVTVEEKAPGRKVTSAAEMPAEVQRVVEMAKEGQFKEAATAGAALIGRPPGQYDDFTWDFLGNAVAYAFLQMGEPRRAADVHAVVATRINDGAVVQYHRLVVSAIAQAARAGGQKEGPAYGRGIREAVDARLKEFKKAAQLATKTRTPPSRIRYLETAYNELRVLAASDPAGSGREALAEFRKSADGLSTDIIPALLEETRAVAGRLEALYKDLMFANEYAQWNNEVVTLWDRVAYVKRYCRMHHYLKSQGLADSNDSVSQFREAHNLLFIPGDPSLVWQQTGGLAVLNGVTHRDLRRKVPYQETKILPIDKDVPMKETTSGWKKMDTMDNSGWNKMAGSAWERMGSSGWNKMDSGGWNKMDSGGWNNMDGGGWNNMDGGGWRK